MPEKIKNIAVVVLAAVFLLGFSVWAWTKPPETESESERRLLATMPEISQEAIKSGEWTADFDTYATDQFPMRDGFRALKAAAAYGMLGLKDNNSIYSADGYLSKIEYPANEYMLDNAATYFQSIYDRFLEGMPVYFSIVPDKNFYLAKANGRLSMDYDAFFTEMRESTPFMQYIDITDTLSIENYYRTDTHWRQETLLPTAQKLSSAMGTPISTDFTENTLDIPFRGVYCGQYALPVKYDTICYLTSDILASCKVTSYNTGMPQEGVMYDFEKAQGRDTYDFFLSGADPFIVIENPNALTDKELIVFRDSFGSSITPLLVSGYSKVTLVDPRYIQSDFLPAFIKFDNQDVLFLFSTTMLNSSISFR